MTNADAPVVPGSIAAQGWFSANPDKAWVEKFFLAYSPVWMASMGLVMLLGGHASWSDGALLVHALLTAAPALLIPLWIASRRPAAQRLPWHQSYWFKANLYLFVFGFFGNYIGSEYFFEVLGMVYVFPNATTTFDSALVGRGEQTVPLIMYGYTHVYFMTYHASANLVLRRVMRAGKVWLFPVAVLAVGYAWAWAETKAMANPMMAENFYYRDIPRMLAVGSAIYATYFVASFPFWYALDERPERRWSVLETLGAALSASMLTLYLLELAAQLVGTI